MRGRTRTVSGSPPTATGTGIPHIVSGVQSAAASTIVNADVSATAAIAGTKVSPDFGSQNITTTGVASIGTTPATAGTVRLPDTGTVQFRNAAADANLIMLGSDSSNRCFLGDSAGDFYRVKPGGGDAGCTFTGEFSFQVGTSQLCTFRTGSTARFVVNTTDLQALVPITGGTTALGVHGVGVQAMADADQTPAVGVYKYGTIRCTGVALTANRTLTVPAATDAASYTKTIVNSCANGAFGIIVSTGTGTTVTVASGANGISAIVRVDAGGVVRCTADSTLV